MRKIEIAKGVFSSALGFGCASILGAKSAKEAERAIKVALECGINHFDIARSYGFGEAEALVGKLLHTQRDEVVIVSKFGIRANWKAQLLAPIKPLVRILKKRPTDASTSSVVRSSQFLNRIPITANNMKKSLDESLLALRTDYLDVFMVHEPLETIQQIEGIFEMADRLKTQGKIKALGLAFMQEQSGLHQSYLSFFDVLQFNNSPFRPDYQHIIDTKKQSRSIFFSPFAAMPSAWFPNQVLHQLTMDFPNCVVLCSMFTEAHIRANAQAVN